MKTLIINGSPRENGNTAFLISELKNDLKGKVVELSAYKNNIKACIDCRFCWEHTYCAIKDDMQVIYNDDFENIIIASPIYMSNLTGPLMSLASRLQVYYAVRRFQKVDLNLKKKNAGLILVGGGDGKPDKAIDLAKWMFKKMNAIYDEENTVFSLSTDNVPASEDKEALIKVKKMINRFNNQES